MKAGFGFRFFAFLLDLLIVLFCEFVIILAVSFVDHNMMSWWRISYEQKMQILLAARIPLVVLFIILPWLYFALFESSARQATYGKFLFDLWVTDLNGKRISFSRASARFFCKFVSALPFLAGFFIALFNKRGQTLHDILCGTLVTFSGKNIEHEGL